MKKIITSTSIILAACVVLCSAVWPQGAEYRNISAEPMEPAVIAEIEAKSGERQQIILSTQNNTPEPKLVAEIEPLKEVVTTIVEKFEPPQPAKPASNSASSPAQPSSDPKPGSKTVIDGKPHVWIPGFGWIEDHGSGSVGITVDGEGDINKQVGVMGGGTRVGNPGDELTGHKVGIMGGCGSVAEDMYENGNKIGIMGGDEPHAGKATFPSAEVPEPEGDVKYIKFAEVPEKNSTPPAYKPNTTSSGQ
ncbi:MAG: hypothetical protein HPY66_2138 [Firmicutes bacterium]|nr:hypothetical protein [Bacillota bacterium]MDI6686877.1 hypothetical protein [Desulfobacterales bacterium]